MISQPPDAYRVAYVLDRCREIHGPETANTVAEWLVSDWNYAAAQADLEGTVDQAAWCAVQQLVRAARLRAQGQTSLANMLDHLAEASVRGWTQELTVRTTETPDTPELD